MDLDARLTVAGQLFRFKRKRGKLMKRAPIIFMAAIALFLTGIVSTAGDNTEKEFQKQTLDMQGIDTVDLLIENGSANIQIDDSQPASIHNQNTYHGLDSVESDLNAEFFQAEKQGRTLVITVKRSENASYHAAQLSLPSTVRRLIVNEAEISTSLKLDTMELQAGRRVSWSGSVKNLRLTEKQMACEYRCELYATIRDGNIDQLYVQANKVSLELVQANTIGIAELALGENSSLNLRPIGSLKNIVIKEYPAKQTLAAPLEAPGVGQ
jgi:transcriptional antiterminator Rof (Rho-off)